MRKQKMFNGKRFYASGAFNSQDAAKKEATIYRHGGFKTRVVWEKGAGSGVGAYVLYLDVNL